VLVVRTGNSGAEIAADLVEGGAAEVFLSVRTPPTILPRSLLGAPTQGLGIVLRRLPPRFVDRVAGLAQRLVFGDLTKHGMPKASRGMYTRVLEDDAIPVLDVGLVKLLKRGQVEVVPAVQAFEGDEVHLAGARTVRPDAVIAATGFGRGLEPIVGHLGVLAANGRPLVHGASTAPGMPGLHFIGYTNPVSGNLREMAIDARRIARAVAAQSETVSATTQSR
jgi:cation diffusion facilitator CzcD-associated flavoprotein CzcO